MNQPAVPTNDFPLPSTQRVSQSTIVEQSRAVAEVQAAVFVAQQNPRSPGKALAEMREACSRLSVASAAFYTVPNRGAGRSVHLARELARIWGNLDYGVRELHRDDDTGMSEIQAFAWDQESNVRSTRTFQVPHERMKSGKRQKLVDLGDVYLNNQNIGARAVRECIFSILPRSFVDEAADRCTATLANGEGVPMAERITAMIGKFAEIEVRLPQLETKIGRPRGAWTPADLADMAIAYQSVTKEGVPVDDIFPHVVTTSDEIMGQQR